MNTFFVLRPTQHLLFDILRTIITTMDAREGISDVSLVFDSFDVDLVVKVVMHTMLSA